MNFIKANPSVWDMLARETRPIVLYGMGDGADKILNVFVLRGIQAAAVFASDEFVRGQSFRGFRVERLCEVTARLGKDIAIVIAFASQRPEIIKRMYELDTQYDVWAPDVPVAGKELVTPEFIHAHAREIEKAYNLLEDKISRQVFENILRFKLSGRLCHLKECTTDKDEVFLKLLCPNAQEHFVDLGAYNGDTIRELLQYTEGFFAAITAFEPDKKNRKKLVQYNLDALGGRIEIIPAGVWKQDGTQHFAAKAGRNSALSTEGIELPVRSVDSVLHDKICTLLKADVEGAEQEALLGAKETIKKWMPRLNIAAYHRSEDLFALPLLIHKLCPSYHIYLRHHPYIPAWDTNLYAIP